MAYNIELEFLGTWTDAASSAVVLAADKWEAIITDGGGSETHPSTRCMDGSVNPYSGNTIQDLYITLSATRMADGVLGGATVCNRRTDSSYYLMPYNAKILYC